jgi:hypothetical protein
MRSKFSYPLLNKKKTIPYFVVLVIWYSGILSIILCLILGGELKHNIFLLIFMISFLIRFLGNFVVKKYKIIGSIEFTSDVIRVINTEERNFELNKTTNIILDYYGAMGEPVGLYFGSLLFKDGSGNFVSFEYENVSYQFGFMIKKKYFLNSICLILRGWKDNNVDFKILNQNKKDITSKVLNR